MFLNKNILFAEVLLVTLAGSLLLHEVPWAPPAIYVVACVVAYLVAPSRRLEP